jgi:hypothetical protein
MPTVINKLVGTFKLGDTATGMAMEAQISQIGTPQTVTRDSPVTVLTGDVVLAAATYSWSIVGQALLDVSDPSGIYYFVVENQGQELAFEFCPIGATAGPTITGTCIVDGWDTEEIAAGSIVQSKFTWPVQGIITRTPPA